MDLNAIQSENFSSGSGMMMNSSSFSCLATELLSSTMVTDESFWTILEGLRPATPYIAAVIFIFFGISFFWNLFIIITYLVKYRLLKEPANIFLFTLAIFDLIASIVMALFSFIIEAAQEYIFGSDDVTRCQTCDMVGFFFVFVVCGSLHLLTALSIDRFIHLWRPLRYKKIMNHWKALVVVVFIVILSFLFAILPIAIGFGQYEFNIRFGICLARLTGRSRSNIPNVFFFFFLVVEALIPITILSVTNVFTFRIVKRFLRRNFRRRSTYRHKREEQSEDAKKHSQQQNQLVKVFGALFVANAISWSLIIVVVLLVTFIIPPELVPDWLYIIGWLCYLTNPLFHPILESFFIKDLRLVINRAKKGVHRAGTLVIRQSSKFLGLTPNGKSSALDEANARIDREEREVAETVSSGFNSSVANSSVATEASEMSELSGASPILSHSNSVKGENGDVNRPKSLKKSGRSVTFSEGEMGAAIPSSNGEPHKTGSVLKRKNGNKKPSTPITDSIVEEDEGVFGTSKTEESGKDTLQAVEEEVHVPAESATENGVTKSEMAEENGTAPGPTVTMIDS